MTTDAQSIPRQRSGCSGSGREWTTHTNGCAYVLTSSEGGTSGKVDVECPAGQGVLGLSSAVGGPTVVQLTGESFGGETVGGDGQSLSVAGFIRDRTQSTGIPDPGQRTGPASRLGSQTRRPGARPALGWPS